MQYSESKCCITTDITNHYDRKTKPSSPREFFDKIYGDETEKLPHSSYNMVEHLFSAKKNTKWERDYQTITDKCWQSRFVYESNVEASTTSLCGTRATSMQSVTHGLSIFLQRKKRKGGKLRRQRTTFSNKQTSQLENEFRMNEYIPRNRRQELAECLQLTEMQIKIWFQNRRAKDKRLEKAQLDQQYRSLIAAQRYFELIAM